MLANVDLEVNEEFPLHEDEIRDICEFVLVSEGVSRPCFVSVSIVDEDAMRELNFRWRNQDRPTDVLSLECERPDDPELGIGEPCELGDVVFAPTYIRNQAARVGTTFADECRLLLVHGMLHLLGYDHLEEEEAVRMEHREDEILAQLSADHEMPGVILTRHEGEATA